MKVIVFGATGTVGKQFVREALNGGCQVTAFARTPEKLEIEHQKLSIYRGDALDAAAVADAVRGHDAVVVTLGASASWKSKIRSEGTRNVIDAMKRYGVQRLVCQSTIGAHESWGNLNLFWKWIMFGALLRAALKDHEKQEDLVRASGLNWTLVRPSAFTDGPAEGKYKVGFGPGERRLSLKIPSADIAGFLERQLTDTRFVRCAVGISC